MIIGIRRQIKIDNESVSFARLLKEISEAPEVFSRDRYIVHSKDAEFVKHMPDYPNRDFDRFSGEGEGKGYINPDMVRGDLETLQAKAHKCVDYADKRVAHYDKREPKEIPKFVDADECINCLEELTIKYYLLFTAGNLFAVLPTFQYDWKAIFQEPWLPVRENTSKFRNIET